MEEGDGHNIRGNSIKRDGDRKAFHNFSNIEYNLMTTNREDDGSTSQANIRENTITARNGASNVGIFNFHNVYVWSNAGQPQLNVFAQGSDDSNLSDSLLPSSSPRISTNYDEPGNVASEVYDELGNVASEVAPSGSNTSESVAINIGNDLGQPHHMRRITALELTFMLVGFTLEMLSAGFDQVSSASKPLYALISLLLAIAAVLTCILELILNGIKNKDASPNRPVFGTLPDIFGLGLAVIQCVCSAVQYYFLHRHASNPMKLSPVPLFFFTCLVVFKLKGN